MIEEDNQQQQAQEASQNDLAAQTGRANRIEARLKLTLLESELERAATRGRAYNPSQVFALLRDRARVIKATDANGNELMDEYRVVVNTEGGETVTAREAVEALRNTDPNIFFSPDDLKGDDNAREGESNMQMMVRLAKTNPTEYHRLRREKPDLLGLRRRRR